MARNRVSGSPEPPHHNETCEKLAHTKHGGDHEVVDVEDGLNHEHLAQENEPEEDQEEDSSAFRSLDWHKGQATHGASQIDRLAQGREEFFASCRVSDFHFSQLVGRLLTVVSSVAAGTSFEKVLAAA